MLWCDWRIVHLSDSTYKIHTLRSRAVGYATQLSYRMFHRRNNAILIGIPEVLHPFQHDLASVSLLVLAPVVEDHGEC